MLLSMYLSYRLANQDKKKFVLLIGFFVMLVSFCSALLPIDNVAVAFFFAPVSVFSFPFYGFVELLFFEGLEWVRFVKIRFLTLDLTTLLPMSLGRLIAFPLYLSVNIVGVLLGYWVGRKYTIQFFRSDNWLILQMLLAIIGIGQAFIFSLVYEDSWAGQHIGLNLLLFGFVMMDTLLLSLLLNNYSVQKPTVEQEYQAR